VVWKHEGELERGELVARLAAAGVTAAR
jgi:hypothetical protein